MGHVKRNPSLIDRHAPRIAAIDRRAFEKWARLLIGIRGGTLLMALASVLGAALVVWSHSLSDPWNAVALLGGGGGVLVTTTHGLAHLVVGRMVGIRFTHWFVASPGRPQPGVKVDYATYLRASPRARAWMHASGAIVTKALPFVLLAILPDGFPAWATWLLWGQGVLQILTDAVWSVKVSDWKKFRRELSYI